VKLPPGPIQIVRRYTVSCGPARKTSNSGASSANFGSSSKSDWARYAVGSDAGSAEGILPKMNASRNRPSGQLLTSAMVGQLTQTHVHALEVGVEVSSAPLAHFHFDLFVLPDRSDRGETI